MKAFIPIELDLSAFRHSTKYLFIITSIFYRRAMDKTAKAMSYVSLNAKLLKHILGGRYKRYLLDLLQMGIIESNNSYRLNDSSKGYRIAQKYESQKVRMIEYHDPRIEQRIDAYKKQRDENVLTNQCQYILTCLKQIKIKREEALAYIDKMPLDYDQYRCYTISVELIAEGDFFFVQDKTAGRIHNNVTNFPRELRKFLTYGANVLVEIDIANSQPFLFNLLIEDYFREVIDSSYGHQTSTNMSDIKLYRELTSQGNFYEYLMEHFNVIEDRDSFKITFFSKIFYSRESDKKVSKERKLFRRLFPNVANIVSFYKKDDYRQLAIKLQRAEANIIINEIVPKLAESEIFIISIHDSFLTTFENVDQVEKIILSEFRNRYGLIPKIRIKGKGNE